MATLKKFTVKLFCTKSKMFSLLFLVPPQKPLIMDERGRQVEGEMGIGPFKEGDTLTLECHVPGGKLTRFTYLLYLML